MWHLILMVLLPCALGECPPPEECPAPDDLLCQGPPDMDGCPMTMCIPNFPSYDDCPPMGCPIFCAENEWFCPGEWDGMCRTSDFCVPLTDNCPGTCPVNCYPEEIYCPGPTDENGCEAPATCLPNDPSSPVPVHCPVYCQQHEFLCPGGYDTEGWPLPDTCAPFNPDCPNSNPCPKNCGAHEQLCPGGLDQDGCPMPDYCMYLERDCPAYCYAQCHDNEIYCPGQRDHVTGCLGPDYCHPMQYDIEGNYCPSFCPTTCGPNEILCPGGIDCFGCQVEDICIYSDPNQPAECPAPWNPENRSCA